MHAKSKEVVNLASRSTVEMYTEAKSTRAEAIANRTQLMAPPVQIQRANPTCA
jgi:hypothetical protein